MQNASDVVTMSLRPVTNVILQTQQETGHKAKANM